jgi:cytidine deaminase
MSQKDFSDLLSTAKQIECNSYSPLSNLSNGVALLCENGDIYTGCTLEISNFSSSVCAANVALVKAISDGVRKFSAVAITGDNADINYLCGDCRQIYAEFGTDLIVISEIYPDDYKVLSDLLPQTEPAVSHFHRST